MTPARKITLPPAPLPSLRARASRLLSTVPAEVFALRDRAAARREAVRDRDDALDKLERRAADRLDREAAAHDAAAEELAWLMSLGAP